MPPHDDIVLAHEEKFKNYDQRIENVFKMLDRMWEAIEKSTVIMADHTKDSTERILKIDRHEIQICQLEKDIVKITDGHKEIRFWAITILLSVIGTALYITLVFGGKLEALKRLELLHPIPSVYQALQGELAK
jgi:hypothetical protein